MSEIRYRPEIDGLRALAVVLVVGYHAFPGKVLEGFIGVDVFFVISGYLITALILTGLRNETFSYLDFYARRIRRIFPALAAVLIAVLIFGWYSLLGDEFTSLMNETIASALFSANILFWSQSGYFDTSALTKPLLHLWSLGVEEQFYLGWPITLAVIYRLRPNAVFTATIIVAICSFALSVAIGTQYPTAAFYLPFTRLWELVAGGILWQLALPGLSGRKSDLAAFVGLALIIAAAFGLFQWASPPAWALTAPVLGTILLLASEQKAWITRSCLSNRLAVYVGLISYPLYLWHWPLLTFLRINEFGAEPIWQKRVAAIGLAFLLAAITFLLVERPIRFHHRLKPIAVPLLLASMGAIAFAGFVSPPIRERLAPEFSIDSRQLKWTFWENKTCNTQYPWSNRYGWWFCIKNKPNPPTLILLGDSNANHLYPGLASNPALSRQSILSIGACAPVLGIISVSGAIGENPCAGKRKLEQDAFLQQLVRETPTIKYAILSAEWRSFTDSGLEADPFTLNPIPATFRPVAPMQEGNTTPLQMWAQALQAEIYFLQERGITVILFEDLPRLPFDIRACLPRPLRSGKDNCEIDAKPQRRMRAGFDEIVRILREANPRLLVYDPMPTFCSQEKCQLKAGGNLYWRDDEHLSYAGSERVAADFIKWARIHTPDMLNP